MDRLQKKCFIGSIGLHSLLVLLLFVGPGFLASTSKPVEVPPIDFFPDEVVDAALSGGGSLSGGRQPEPPKEQPPSNIIVPPPPQREEPPPPKEEPKQDPVPPKVEKPQPAEPKDQNSKSQKSDPDSLELKKPKLPQVSTKVYQGQKQQKTAQKSQDDNKERMAALEAQRRNELGKAISRIAGNIRPSATSIESYGPGSGGPTYAGYASYVKMVYEAAWLPPEDTSRDDATVAATITIARDGRILDATISRGSGDAQVDLSVRRTLERVTTIGRPFPDGMKESKRTYIINFNLKAKRGLA